MEDGEDDDEGDGDLGEEAECDYLENDDDDHERK